MNNPLIPGVLDAGASYSYSWIRGAFRGHANTIGAYTTAYTVLNGVKPFAGAALGYQWNSFGPGVDDQALWGLTTGVEIPAGALPALPVKLMLNVGNPDLAYALSMLPSAGGGLARLEFLIAHRIGVHPRALLDHGGGGDHLEDHRAHTRAGSQGQIHEHGRAEPHS